MPRIESLAILATEKGNDFLAEQYGVVIDNIATGTISSQLKNKDLSGDPTTGSVEAKRFCNSKSNPYGTARAGGKGDKVKAKPVSVAINHNNEIIEEVEEKDASMYGVDGLVERRTANHELVMRKDLEKEFFLCAAVNSEVFTTAETEINKGLITLYKVHEQNYYYVRNFERYQVINKPTPSKLPLPDAENAEEYSGQSKPKPKPVLPPVETKAEYGEFGNVKLTQAEYEKLIDRFGETDTKNAIEELSGYMKSKGKRYTDHYATLINWVKRNQVATGKGSKQAVRSVIGSYQGILKWCDSWRLANKTINKIQGGAYAGTRHTGTTAACVGVSKRHGLRAQKHKTD